MVPSGTDMVVSFPKVAGKSCDIPYLMKDRRRKNLRRITPASWLAAGLTCWLSAVSAPAQDPAYSCSNGDSFTLGELESFLRNNQKGIFNPDQTLSRRGRLVFELASNADELIKLLKWMNDFPAKPAGEVFDRGYKSMYQLDVVGISGPFTGLQSNDAMGDYPFLFDTFRGAAQRAKLPGAERIMSEEYRKRVAARYPELLNDKGVIASADGRQMWEIGYLFHTIRGRMNKFDYTEGGRTVDAISVAWAGGTEGNGSKLLLWMLGDEFNLIKPAGAGEITRTLPVDKTWALKKSVDKKGVPIPKEPNSLRFSADLSRCSFDVGLFLGWRNAEPSYHASWDGLWIINELHEANGATCFVLLDERMKARIGSAIARLEQKVNAPAGSDDYLDHSGYKAKDVEHWIKLIKPEFAKPGVQFILKTFPRLQAQ